MTGKEQSRIPLQPGESHDAFGRPSSAPTVPDDFNTRFLFERPEFGKEVSGKTAGTVPINHGFDEEHHNSSLSNLELYLDSGLVESIDHATKEPQVAGQDLSYSRMARHSRTTRKINGPFDVENSNNNAIFGMFDDRTGIMYASRPPEHSAFANAFPSALATPPRQQQPQPRSTTPVELFPGQHSQDFPCSIEIGTNVVEPEDESQLGMTSHAEEDPEPTLGSDSNGSLKELARGMKNMWSPEAREFKPASGPPSQSSSLSEQGTDITPRQAEAELSAFLWDCSSPNASRTLAILRVAWLRVPDIRAECERFGALESFRVDFLSRGIVFASYYDIRSAQYASKELQPQLQRLSVMHGSSDDVSVHFCLPLNSSSQFDEARIQIANVPPEVNEFSITTWLSQYGSLRSVVLLGDKKSYIVEYHNLQDAKQALLELESCRPWGQQVFVEVCIRDTFQRRKGRELLSIVSRWRQMLGSQSGSVGGMTHPAASSSTRAEWGAQAQDHRLLHAQKRHNGQMQYDPAPDGRYTVVPGNGVMGVQHNFDADAVYDPHGHHQMVLQGPNGQYYVANSKQSGGAWNSHTGYGNNANMMSNTPSRVASTYGDPRHHQDHRQSSYAPNRISSDATSASGRSHYSQYSSRSGNSLATTEERDNRHLTLDLEAVEEGVDTRTSLMVRNIPNKYTQQMLLSEFDDNGHGPGVIDFFYLPIDFKNRCNRGYAFINFVDYKDILDFHRRYYGKHWRTFNSDKICDITYARIQGKEAMLKRFQNSALMEKTDEYKPLVFASEGPQKGKREPFPFPNSSRHETKSRVEV